MGWKSSLIKPFAKKIHGKILQEAQSAVATQKSLFQFLLARAVETEFGKAHGFGQIRSHEDYQKSVPIRDYEGHRPYVDRIIAGHKDVLWPGRPKYFAKTSGTTSGVKYIPITKDSIPNHFGTARNALFNYSCQTDNYSFFDGKLIFLSGSPKLDKVSGIPTGRLSGIVNHMVPKWLRTNQLPSYATNCIDDWEQKLDAILEETIDQDMRLISGIPPWVKMYFERLLSRSGRETIKDIFPEFSVFVYGGVNYEPYRSTMEQMMGPGVETIETYPASEGFIAFQDQPGSSDLLLNTSSGIFFEFVPLDEIHQESPQRLTLEQVELGVQYALLLSSNAGLWAYSIGDTIEFVSLDPYRIHVTGRVAHFISAFGEHVIAKEVERAMQAASEQTRAQVVEFTVAPNVQPVDGSTAHHEWWIEFEGDQPDVKTFERLLDQSLQDQNIYYQDLIQGGILRPLVVRAVSPGAFVNYMKSIGKLGGQNKVPRLTNDRKIADQLVAYL